MRRRNFMTTIAAVLAGALLPAAGVAQEAERDAVAFVRRIYQREILRDVRGAKIGDAGFYALFPQDPRRLLQSPVPPRPDIALGPLSHAFYGPGVLPGTEVTLQNV